MRRSISAGLIAVAIVGVVAGRSDAKRWSPESSFDDGSLSAGVTTADDAPGPRSGERPFHYEVTYSPSTIGGCVDARIETVVRVWDDGSGRREVVYAGCPRPNLDRPAPPTTEQVRDAIGIPTPTIATNPATKTLAGLATYFWYTGPAERTVTVTLNGFTVTATARAASYEWSLGDGTTHTTTTGGTEEDPAVTHAYTHKGAKTVTLTITWQGTFTFAGPGNVSGEGDLGSRELTGTRTYPVEEVQAVGRRA